MVRKFFGLTVLVIYLLVIAVASTTGPLVSLQSIILGLLGLIVITIGISALAKSIGLVDIPDNIRKLHEGNVPLIGGIVIFISVLYGTFDFGYTAGKEGHPRANTMFFSVNIKIRSESVV